MLSASLSGISLEETNVSPLLRFDDVRGRSVFRLGAWTEGSMKRRPLQHPSHRAYQIGCRLPCCTEFMREYSIGLRARHYVKRRAPAREYKRSPAGKQTYRKAWLKKKYQMTPEEYDARFISQQGCCALCKVLYDARTWSRRLAVDHDHTTGRIRGLLCGRCNRRLGWFEALREGILGYTNTPVC